MENRSTHLHNDREIHPTVSVVVITANRPSHLRRCLRSLQHQTARPHEIIVVDGSKNHSATTDITHHLKFRHPVILLYDIKHSIPYARDLGAQKSRGDIVAYLDDDLSADPTYLSRLRQHFVLNTRLSAVFGRIQNALNDNVYASTQYAYYDRGLRHHFPSFKVVQPLTAGRMLDCEVMGIRRSVITRIRFHWPKPFRNEDVELGLRLIQAKKKILFDPHITAWTYPRTSLLPLLSVSIQNGYWDAYIEKHFNVNLRSAPYRTRFISWIFHETQAKIEFSLYKKIWYAIILTLYAVLTRMGNLWYHVRTII
jgi:glycosyltransferase involved in cell wall biosynthesis